MSNESLVTIPRDTPVELRRSLEKIVEELDIIVGNKGTDAAATQNELAAERTTLVTLSNRITIVEQQVAQLESGMTTESAQEQAPSDYLELTGDFLDFNNDVWSGRTLNGYATGDGSIYTNPPFTVVTDTTYTVFVQSHRVQSTGVHQTMTVLVSGQDLQRYIRVGLTWASALSEGWTQL